MKIGYELTKRATNSAPVAGMTPFVALLHAGFATVVPRGADRDPAANPGPLGPADSVPRSRHVF